MNIRPASLATDVPGIAQVCRACEPDNPLTIDQVREWFKPPKHGRIQHHLVAVDEQDAPTGYACVIHTAQAPAGHFYTWMGVDPPHRRNGTGAALWETCLAFLRENNATRLASEVLDNDSTSLAFAEQRGFAIDRHRFHSVLDLDSFDEEPYLPVIANLENQGIRFCSLADFPDIPEINNSFMALNLAVVRDIPGEIWNFDAYPQFFAERILGAKWFRREGQLLALDGEIWVGFATVSLQPENASAYNRTTGVIRSHRGRKIAQTLKVLAARYARAHGACQISTDNDSLNAPMLAINRKMGYQAQYGQYYLVRWLE